MALFLLPTIADDIYAVEDRLIAKVERASMGHGQKNKKTAGRMTASGALYVTGYMPAMPEGVAP